MYRTERYNLMPRHLKGSNIKYHKIGCVAVVRPNKDNIAQEEVAKAIMGEDKDITAVLEKSSTHNKILAGETTETVYKENGCRFKVDPSKVFLSTWLSGERKRLASEVVPGEEIFCPFAGAGPFPIILSKLGGAVATGIERSPDGFRFFQENIIANRLVERITPYFGSMENFEFPGRFDRAVAPAPFVKSEKLSYLRYIIPSVKEGGMIHYYTLGRMTEKDALVRDAQHIAEKMNREVEIKAIRKCGSFSPRVYRLVMDMVV